MNEKTSLEIKKFINALPARLYDAWTDSAQLKECLDQKTCVPETSLRTCASVVNIAGT
jgi:uncharacterized protein YndB with AHSA1/START domain